MHRYASSPFFFLYFRILLTFQADQTPVAVSSLGMLLRSSFGGTLCLLLCYRRYDHHRIAHAFPVYYTFLACASHHTLCLLLCYRRYSSPGHCDCELPAALLSVVSRGIFTETSRQPTEPLSVRPLHAPRARYSSPLSRSIHRIAARTVRPLASPALCSTPCSTHSLQPLQSRAPPRLSPA